MAVPKVHKLRERIGKLARKHFPQGKQNYKWKVIPAKWPKDIPFLDPNNKDKDLGKKPTKDELEKMYEYLMTLEKTETIPVSIGLFDGDNLANEFEVEDNGYLVDISDDYEVTTEVYDSDDLSFHRPSEEEVDQGNEILEDSGILIPSFTDQIVSAQCTDPNDDFDFSPNLPELFPPLYMDDQTHCIYSSCELVPGCKDHDVPATFLGDIIDLESLHIRPKTNQTMDIIKESKVHFPHEEPTSLFNDRSETNDTKNEDWTMPEGSSSKCIFETLIDCSFNMKPSKETKETEMASTTTSSSSDSDAYLLEHGPPRKKAKLEDISQNNQSCFIKRTCLKQDAGIDPTRKKPPKIVAIYGKHGINIMTWQHT